MFHGAPLDLANLAVASASPGPNSQMTTLRSPREITRAHLRNMRPFPRDRPGRAGITSAEHHRARIMRKLNINDIPGLVRYAIRNGLVDQNLK